MTSQDAIGVGTLLVGAMTLIGGFIIVGLQNQSAKRLTCLQIFVGVAAQYDAPDMQLCRASLARCLLADRNALEINDRLLVFYENIAILNRRHVLDEELLANTFAVDVCGYWYALEHYVRHVRDKFKDESLYIEFQRLKDRFERQTGYGFLRKQTEEETRTFLEMETRRDP
ncbi:MAG TPA: DUF4760 domain-containing protein [Caulobacterales bacterium]|nr:DUF4760 domain-containing protein [Caulobacterales bacterium]